MAKPHLSETCSDKTENELHSVVTSGSKEEEASYAKGKRKLSNKVTSAASGNPRDDKS